MAGVDVVSDWDDHIGARLEAVLQDTGVAFSWNADVLIFGGQSESRRSRLAAFAALTVAVVALFFGAAFLSRGNGWLRWILGPLLLIAGILLSSAGGMLLRYKHIVRLDQSSKEVRLEETGGQTVWCGFADVRHFKQTRHMRRGRYLNTSLSLVSRDERELRLATYDAADLSSGADVIINRLLWRWMNGHVTEGG